MSVMVPFLDFCVDFLGKFDNYWFLRLVVD